MSNLTANVGADELIDAKLADEVVGTFDCPICGCASPHFHSGTDQIRHINAQRLARVLVEDYEAFEAWTKRADLGSQPTMLWDAWLAAREYYRGKANE